MQSIEERFSKIRKIGTQSRFGVDFYHSLLVCNWKKFFALYLGAFFLFNLFFAFLYWLNPQTLSGTDTSFWHAFAFSVQTFSTVGYGAFAPKSDVSHLIVIVESVFSIFITALLTGLIFAKFSRPSARIVFSKNVLINNFQGKRTLMLRMGNLRANQIAEAHVRIVALKSVKTAEGQSTRMQIDIPLLRSSSLFFGLSWSVMHEINESSPFFNMTSKDLISQNIEIGVSLIGYDATFSQSIHANCIYSAQDVVFDKYFEDVFEIKNDQVISLDYRKFNNLNG